MQEFTDLLNNQLLLWSLIACISAQLFKVVFNFFSSGEIRWAVIFETGGMPSSHSSLITGITSGLGLELGFDHPVFALGVGISLVIMYDASGVRRSAGLHAVQINKIANQLNQADKLNLKETLGHSKLEVIVGSIFGPLITLLGMKFLGSPLDILHSISRFF